MDFYTNLTSKVQKVGWLRVTLLCTKFDFGCGSAPDPAGGAYSAPPDPLADLMGPTSKGRRQEGNGGEGSGGEGRGCTQFRVIVVTDPQTRKHQWLKWSCDAAGLT